MLVRNSGSDALPTAWLRDAVKPARVAGKAARVILALVLLGHALLILLVLVTSLGLRRWNPPGTALMEYRILTQHQTIRPVRFVPLRQIPRVARAMVLRLEDYRFYQHWGIDLGALREAYLINRSLGRTVVGGSTIPMQLARNLFLTPRKTYFRKYLESIVAVEMSLLVPKDRILEIYLNYIEWGKGIFGIGQAASYYYHSTVSDLSLDELRRLITIITNPVRYNVATFRGSRQMAERYAYLVERFPDQAAVESPAAAEPPPPALLNPDTAAEEGTPPIQELPPPAPPPPSQEPSDAAMSPGLPLPQPPVQSDQPPTATTTLSGSP